MKRVKTKDRSKLKKEIGNYLIEQTLSDVGGQKSPVTGRSFKQLSKSYRDFKKSKASPIPNLELTGDMLDAFKFREKRNGIEIGIFNEKQAQKADNHNKFSAKSKKTNVPKRAFIPKKGESNYRPDIRKEILNIVKEFEIDE